MSRDDREDGNDLAVDLFGEPGPSRPSTPQPRRADRHRGNRRRKRRSRVVPLISFILVLALIGSGWIVARRVIDHFSAKDYAGTGTGSVVVEIKTGDTSSQIGSTLTGDGVVASQRAFVDAANRSGRSQDFQAGFFAMRLHMSAQSAVSLLLDPNSRVSNRVTVIEGRTVAEILPLLAAKLQIPLADLQAAAAQPAQLGLPDGYTEKSDSYAQKSVEGFLFPQTYEFDPDVSATDALQDLTAQFGTVVRSLNFTADAAKLHVTPYEALTIASMIEAETVSDADRSKVARVIYNRLAKKMNLGFDSTSAYGLEIEGKDPKTVTYREKSPYNTRLYPGLPPTPIDNPGEKSMAAAVNPAAGNWLYFVNKDAAGDLFFTDNYQAFLVASAKCVAEHWGCT